MSTRAFGARIKRNIDPALLKAKAPSSTTSRSPIRSTPPSSAARSRGRGSSRSTSRRRCAHPGVAAVYTGDDIGELDREMPLLIPHSSMKNARTQRPLAKGDVYYVGQTVVMVVGVDRYTAEDAAALVEVDYEPLPVEVDIEEAVKPGAPLVHDTHPGNIAAHFVQVSGNPDAAIPEAEHVTRIRVKVERSTAAPMECRAVAASFDVVTGELTVWDGTQAPISVRGGLASIFRLDEDKVRVIAPNVGGGFGQKVLLFYPDELLVPMAAMQLGRPVKYIEDRRENFIGSSQERTQVHWIELYAKKTGEVIALRDSFLHDTGAFIPYGIAVAQVASTSIAGPYRIPNIWVEFKAVYTPTVPVTPYRGCGRPQSCFAIERAMDQLAEELGLDRFEVRRRNLIAEDQFPWPREGLLFADGLRVSLDSGQYHKALEMVADRLGAAGFAAKQAEAQAEGRYLGLGLAFYVEGTGLGPYEGGHVKVHPITGKVYVNTGLTSQGQGHETVFAQIVADQLGVAVEDVILVEGDTKAFDWGVATFASRAAVVSGNAIYKTALIVRGQIIHAAANMLEASEEDIELRDGAAWIKGTDRKVPLAADRHRHQPAPLRLQRSGAGRHAVRPGEPPRRAAARRGPASRPGGDRLLQPGLRHLGLRRPRRHRRGRSRPLRGQDQEICLHPRLRQHDQPDDRRRPGDGRHRAGIGRRPVRADRVRRRTATPLNANFVDFLVPYATEVPNVEVLHLETPSPLNPLGVKGVGEAGCIAVGAVIASGIEDALRPLGAGKFHQTPITPSMIHAALEAA